MYVNAKILGYPSVCVCVCVCVCARARACVCSHKGNPSGTAVIITDTDNHTLICLVCKEDWGHRMAWATFYDDSFRLHWDVWYLAFTLKNMSYGAPGWFSQLSIWLLISTQVMISRFVSLSPALSSVPTVQSLREILSLPLSLSLPPSLSKIK